MTRWERSSLDSTADDRKAQAREFVDTSWVLTVAAHPDLSRIGETAAVASAGKAATSRTPESACISRTEPVFAAPGSSVGRPLAHGSVSRTPITLTFLTDAIRLDIGACGTEVRVEGALIPSGGVEFDTTQLADGVFIELGGRVAVLCHMAHSWSPFEPHIAGLIGASDAVRALRTVIAETAPLAASVLIRGETGSGKELVAAALHAASPRADGPFRAVNLGAIPVSTASAELFGHTRGAFTGAERDADGWFGQADGGTLFLDEVGETPADVQPMLLRALESGEIQPIGARRVRRVDVRVIAATDADLALGMSSGRFRPALWHRLAQVVIDVPPLRRRRDDIPRLLVHLLKHALATAGVPFGPDLPAPPAAWIGGLLRHSWPGNVRELRNVALQTALAIQRHLRTGQPVAWPTVGDAPPERSTAPRAAPAVRRAVDLTRNEILAALDASGHEIAAAARALGVSNPALHATIARLFLVPRAKDLSRELVEGALAQRGGDAGAAAEALGVSRRALLLRKRELGLP